MGKQTNDDHVVVDVEGPFQKKRKTTDEVKYLLWTDRHDLFKYYMFTHDSSLGGGGGDSFLLLILDNN